MPEDLQEERGAADLIDRAHEAGILWIQQVMNRRQAEEAITAGANVIVAQGSEAGGNSGWVSTMVLVPQVVDIAGDTPVVAADDIRDGRGLAAALVLGAQGSAWAPGAVRLTGWCP